MAFKDLRGILQYVPQFRGRTFVVSVEGGVLSSDRLSTLALDLALLHSLNVHLVLVYGVSHHIGDEADSSGSDELTISFHKPIDLPTLQLATEEAARIGNDIAGNLATAGLRSVVPNAISAHAAGVVDGLDQGHLGRVDRVDKEALSLLIEQEMIPVLSPLGFGGKGEALLLDSDELAVEVGMALGAAKVIFLSSGDSLLPGLTPPQQLTVLEAKEWAGSVRSTSSPAEKHLGRKLKFAARGCKAEIARCHLLNGLQDESLLAELFSNEGVGLMVYADDYLQVRSATHTDIPEMSQMMQQSVDDGELLARTSEQLAAQLRDFSVVEVDGNIVACVAVHDHGEALAELACLYVKRAHEGRGYGAYLVRHAEKAALEAGATALFALSTGAYHYFEKRGFERVDDFALPARRQEAYHESGRNSVILVRNLAETIAT